jgi:hypothetical protein
MTERPLTPTPDEPSIDLAVLAADDRVLDDLGRGGPAPAGDPVAALLAGWRADLDDDTGSAPPADVDPTRPVPPVSVAARRRPSRVRWIVAAAAAVLLAGAGLVVGAGDATPGSPLWPITRVVYPQRADTAAAEHAIARARRAAEQGRYGDAQRLIAEAETLVARVSDPAQARRLRAELDAVRALMPAATPVPGTPRPGGDTPSPGGTGPAVPPEPSAGPAPGPTTAGPGPGKPPAPGLPLPPILPSVGVPPPPLPLPTPSLPLPLPSLPILGGH